MSYSDPRYQVARFTAGTALSSVLSLGAVPLLGLRIPAGWTAASITLQESQDGTTWYDVYDATGAEVVIAAAAGRFVQLPAASFLGFENVRLRSGTAASPVNQASAVNVTAALRGFL